MFRLLALLAVTCSFLPRAFAFEWTSRELVTRPFDVPAGETRSVSLNGNFQIKNLIVQARASGTQGGLVEVVVNGEVKGTIYVPGADPSYVVTVGEGASSIEFVSRASGSVRIDRIVGVISNTGTEARPQPVDPIALLLPRNEITELARSAIKSVDALMAWTTADDQDKYLVPIKVASGRLYALATSRGMASAKTATAVKALITQFDLAQTFFDRSLTCRECFQDVVQLLAVRERLDKAIE